MDFEIVSIRVPFCFIEAKCGSFRVSSVFLESLFGVFEASWGAFWASRGSLGSLLGRSYVVLGEIGWSRGGFWGTSILDYLLE